MFSATSTAPKASSGDSVGDELTIARYYADLQFGDNIVDGITNRLQILQVFVIDMETGNGASDFLFERLDQFDERQRIGVEVIDERGPFSDRHGFDFENVGKPVSDDSQNGGTVKGAHGQRGYLPTDDDERCIAAFGDSAQGNSRSKLPTRATKLGWGSACPLPLLSRSWRCPDALAWSDS